MTKCLICTDNTYPISSKDCLLCEGKGEVKPITSVENFLEKLKSNPTNTNKKYYRGENQYYGETSLQPSIMRRPPSASENLIKQEHRIFRDIVSRCPEDFQGMDSTFEKLVKMQHYFLPTRLLDITENPLVALYFSCMDSEKDGIVYIFEIAEKDIKFFDSETVSIISNLAKIEKPNSLSKITDFKNTNEYKKLLFQIHQEKASFKDRINPDDPFSIYCVTPKLDNKRIKAQNGAFFIFGMDENTPHEAVANIYKSSINIKGLLIDKDSKKKIIEQLDKLNVHKASLFPEIDSVSKYIIDKYYRPISKATEDIKKDTNSIIESTSKTSFNEPSTKAEHLVQENKYREFLICNEVLNNEKVRAKFHFPKHTTSETQNEFIKLLFGSFSLSLDEKKKVINRLETLSEFQIDALVEVFYEENEKFHSLFKEYPNDIVKLSIEAVKVWHQLIYDGKNLKNYLENLFSCTIYDNDDFKNSYYIHLLNFILENANLYEKKQLQEVLTKIESYIGTQTEKFLALFFKYEENDVVNETLYDFLIEREGEIINSDTFTRFYQSIGIFYAKKEKYEKAFKYFDKIKNKNCMLDYVEMALMIDKINEAELYLKDKYKECNESESDYDILHKLFSIIIDCIKYKEDKTSNFSQNKISEKATNLWSKVSRLTTIELNWNFSEVEAIISKYSLESTVKDTDLSKIINKLSTNKKEDSLNKKLVTSEKQKNKTKKKQNNEK